MDGLVMGVISGKNDSCVKFKRFCNGETFDVVHGQTKLIAELHENHHKRECDEPDNRKRNPQHNLKLKKLVMRVTCLTLNDFFFKRKLN